VLAILLGSRGTAISQVRDGVGTPRMTTLVNTVTIMPYLTGSFNTFSGLAFPATAKGLGFGGGLTFDLTDSGQSAGLLFDFAFQDMRGAAQNGGCYIPGLSGGNPAQDTLVQPADAYHYWQYILFEPFLKLQGHNKNGYLLLGVSLGYAVLSESINIPASPSPQQGTLWNGTPYGNQFRLDLRIGLGAKLAQIGTHQLILEMRAGYPVTNAIKSYANLCSGGGTGSWRIITLQANLGLRI